MEAARRPSLRAWAILGVLLGLLALTRWQAIAYAGLLLPLAIEGLVRGRVRLRWIALGALCALAAFAPQLAAWKALFGRALAVPAREHRMSWSSPHLAQVLISADRGLFT